MTFEEFELDEALLSAIRKQRYNKPTPIQQVAIPLMLGRKDILAGAATGTGKTAAFVLPALQYLLDEPKYSNRHPRILILSPTRELAFQIYKVVQKLGYFCNVPSVIITGGFKLKAQIEVLTYPCDIMVATPGRLTKLVEEDAVTLSYVEMVIIDEADRMLDMGQGPVVRALLNTIPDTFQAGLFSATLAGIGIEKFAKDILDNPQVVQMNAPNAKSKQIRQIVYLANDKDHKNTLLKNILKNSSCKSAIIFCNKKNKAIEVTNWLQSQNISAQVLHGDFRQATRLNKINKFKKNKIKVLVATDVAARGLDMLKITHVINYDMPFRGDMYIHRIGRTGRAQQVGMAINLVERHDLKPLERIEYHLKQKIPVKEIPGLESSFTIKEMTKKASQKKRSKKDKVKKLKKPKKYQQPIAHYESPNNGL